MHMTIQQLFLHVFTGMNGSKETTCNAASQNDSWSIETRSKYDILKDTWNEHNQINMIDNPGDRIKAIWYNTSRFKSEVLKSYNGRVRVAQRYVDDEKYLRLLHFRDHETTIMEFQRKYMNSYL